MPSTMELRTFSKSGNPQAATQSSEEQGRVPDTDTIELARAGKKPVLKVAEGSEIGLELTDWTRGGLVLWVWWVSAQA